MSTFCIRELSPKATPAPARQPGLQRMGTSGQSMTATTWNTSDTELSFTPSTSLVAAMSVALTRQFPKSKPNPHPGLTEPFITELSFLIL